MRRKHLAMTVIAVLSLSFLLGTYRAPQDWEYARLSFGYVWPVPDKPVYTPPGWVWTEPGVLVEGEDLEELCEQLGIEVPRNEASVFAVVDWAGSQGWEMVTVQSLRPLRTTSAWFKKPK
jgi:hypothetical protein